MYRTSPIIQNAVDSGGNGNLDANGVMLRKARGMLCELTRAVDNELVFDDPQRFAFPFSMMAELFLFTNKKNAPEREILRLLFHPQQIGRAHV